MVKRIGIMKRKIEDRIHFFMNKKEVLVHLRKKGGGFRLKCHVLDYGMTKIKPFLWSWFWKCVTCKSCLAGKGV